MPQLNINFDEVLLTKFEELEIVVDEEEYVPMYILETEENLKEEYEDIINDMIIDFDEK